MLNQKMLTIINLVGSLLILLSAVLLIPLVVNIFYQDSLALVFIIPALISLVLGVIAVKSTEVKKLSLATGMLVCALGWICISAIGALPFYLTLDYSYLDTLFETVSGFASAGLTLFTDLNQMPKSILFWRSLMQWFGGLGILTFFLFVSFRGQGGMFQLYTAESHKINQSRPVPNINKSIKIIWLIYSFFTLIQIILFYLLGVSLFDSIAHSLTTVSTGGFSTYDSSIGYFAEAGYQNYKIIEYVTIIFMLFGGINFLVHYRVLRGKISELWSNIEMKYFWWIIIIATTLIMGNYYFNFGIELTNVEEVFRKILFQVVSILTTTGYSTESIAGSFFTSFARQIFILFMLIGGCVGSTAGGFKLIRVAILQKLLGREVKKVYYPQNAVLPLVIDGKIIPDNEVFRVVSLFVGWLTIIMIGGVITAISSDLSAWYAFSGIFSAVGNIGPTYFSVEKMQSLSDTIKLTYIIAMLAGRLEILPLFVIFSKQAWRD